ncbi:MAG: LPS export ABC transporter permease LptF [Pseudomonadota bacterium]
MLSILQRYILKEISQFFAVSLLASTFILLVTRIFSFADLIVTKGINPSYVGLLILYSMPYILMYTFPVSILMSVLLAFMRLSHDNEVTAMKASGVSLWRMLPAVAIFSGCVLCASYAAAWVMPKGKVALNDMLINLAKEKAHAVIKPNCFISDFKDVVIYVNEIDRSGKRLYDIFISDKRNPKTSCTIIAKNGIIGSNREENSIILRLNDGSIHYDSKDMTASDTLWFKTYEFSLSLTRLSDESTSGPGKNEMSLSQLFKTIKSLDAMDSRYNNYLMELHRRIAIPFSCLVFGIMGLALGVQFRLHGSSGGISIGMFVFLVYYLLLAAGKNLGESGVYPPVLGMWTPNIFLGALAVIILKKSAQDKPVRLIDGIIYIFHVVREKFKGRFKI